MVEYKLDYFYSKKIYKDFGRIVGLSNQKLEPERDKTKELFAKLLTPINGIGPRIHTKNKHSDNNNTTGYMYTKDGSFSVIRLFKSAVKGEEGYRRGLEIETQPKDAKFPSGLQMILEEHGFIQPSQSSQ